MIDAKYIRQLCREHGTTMTAVAKRMYNGAKQPLSQLSTALRGNPRLDWIERLAKEIGCDTGDLLPHNGGLPEEIEINGIKYIKKEDRV